MSRAGIWARLRRLRTHPVGAHLFGAILGGLAGVGLSQILAAVGYG